MPTEKIVQLYKSILKQERTISHVYKTNDQTVVILLSHPEEYGTQITITLEQSDEL